MQKSSRKVYQLDRSDERPETRKPTIQSVRGPSKSPLIRIPPPAHRVRRALGSSVHIDLLFNKWRRSPSPSLSLCLSHRLALHNGLGQTPI